MRQTLQGAGEEQRGRYGQYEALASLVEWQGGWSRPGERAGDEVGEAGCVTEGLEAWYALGL